jgi:DNA-binding MarR family transcriptional regulator
MKGTNKTRPRRKCEKMENKKETGYTLYDFMMQELGLDGVALKVYALIYSFTKAGSDCHGSVRYIGERTDSAKSSVHRALNELLEKGYIVKLENEGQKTSRYIAKLNPLSQKGTASVPESNCPVPESDSDSPKIGHNNKDNNKPYNYTYNHSFYNNKPRPIQAFGSKKVVMMTLHEYANLLRAVGVKPTLRYVRLLENRIAANRFPVKENHYEMIIDWAREDGLITPEAMEILID